MQTEWATLQMPIVQHKAKSLKIRTLDHITEQADGNQVQISSMKSSKFAQFFQTDVAAWDVFLKTAVKLCDGFYQVQRQYLFMEGLFACADVQNELPNEYDIFHSFEIDWLVMLKDIQLSPSIVPIFYNQQIEKDVFRFIDVLDSIKGKIESYLDIKRGVFPRFYFISNETLVEILGLSKSPSFVLQHLKKLFDNIASLKLQKSIAHAMISSEGEQVDLTKKITLDGNVEQWLKHLEASMQQTIRQKIKHTLDALISLKSDRSQWISKHPGQCLVTASEIHWTSNVNKALRKCFSTKDIDELIAYRKAHQSVLNEYSEMIRSNISSLQRAKLVAIVTKEVHARDVIENLVESKIYDFRAFEWIMQLRQHWEIFEDGKPHCTISQVNTLFRHCYEYLGCSSRLVISPLTDRCYITLTSAIQLMRGGSPKGPAGTGKTETVKDLGKSLGTYVVVFNCSEGLNYKAVGKLFSGLSQVGAWGCFDEFNRINIEVLSVVAQQIQSILQALRTNQTRFMFEGNTIPLVHSVGIFITMNPGYAGRTELPDNLKSMFRPIAMVVPDSIYIAEIILFVEGFTETRELARKVSTLYELSEQQLSYQVHYDFGLRSLTALLRYAGVKKRQRVNLSQEQVLLIAMKDTNIPRMIKDDISLFNSICSDLFPQVDEVKIDYNQIETEIKDIVNSRKLTDTPTLMRKCLELYETKNTRHAVMLVGITMSGKTTCWKILSQALTNLSKKTEAFTNVQVSIINPKALNEDELYGTLNLSTNEWTDGVLSLTMRRLCEDKSEGQKWILFDGPVDAVWIENMNSVMDDNKLLTLANGERIAMPDQVSLLFETENLAEASPATVSRSGIVFFDNRTLEWPHLKTSWLKQVHEHELDNCFTLYFEPMISFKSRNCKDLISIDDVSALHSMIKLFDNLIGSEIKSIKKDMLKRYTRLWFLYAMTWSLCAVLDESSRKLADLRIREMDSSIPKKDTIFEYYVDANNLEWKHWENILENSNWHYQPSIPFHQIIVPTVDTMRYNQLLSSLKSSNCPSLIIGHVGTGKSLIARNIITKQDPTEYTHLTVYASAQTTSKNIQDILEANLEKYGKSNYGPSEGKKMLVLIDDINMPRTDTYGSQPALEFLRLWLDEKFWYDRKTLQLCNTRDISLLATMSTVDSGRSPLPNRLRSCFNVFGLIFPSENEIRRVYTAILSHKINTASADVSRTLDSLVSATFALYKSVEKQFLPIPSKVHYSFNMRDMGRIIEGLLNHNNEVHDTRHKTISLWAHECFRVFDDRLVNEHDHNLFQDLLNDQMMTHFNVLFHHIVESKEYFAFTHIFDKKSIYNAYETAESFEGLRNSILKHIESFRNQKSNTIVIFNDALKHILRICRVISRPKGHMMLLGIGGSGRRSLSQIASELCGYTCFKIEMTENYTLNKFKEDLRRLYLIAGVSDRGTVFLLCDSQITDVRFFEDLNNILNSGFVPNLFRTEDVSQIRAGLEKIVEREGIQPTDAAIMDFLINRVNSNLHVIICMSPSGSNFRNYVRMFPALINCTTIDYFNEWPYDALIEISLNNFDGVDLAMYNERKKAFCDVLASIHLSASNVSNNMRMTTKRVSYTTPTNFLDFNLMLKKLIDRKMASVQNEKDRLVSGLAKIDETRVIVTDASLDLAEKKRVVNLYQENCEQFITELDQQHSAADEKEKTVDVLSKKLADEEVSCKKIADTAEVELNEAMPMLLKANEALNALSKRDISEIRGYTHPPSAVAKVMGAVMILKQKEPTWEEAKRDLGDINFVKSLVNFDKNNISEKVLRKITQIVKSPMFDPEEVGKKSFAAKSVCSWVIAMEAYAQVYKLVRPKIENYERARATLESKQRDLNTARSELSKIQEQIVSLKQNFKNKLQEKDELQHNAAQTELFLDRATKLLEAVSNKRVIWKNTVEELRSYDRFLIGDCILTSTFIAYSGSLNQECRDNLFNESLAILKRQRILYSEDFKLSNYISSQTEIRDWNIDGLPMDSFSSDNAIVSTYHTRFSFFVDPQSQALKWLKRVLIKSNHMVTDPRRDDFQSTLEQCVLQNIPCICQNMGNEIPGALDNFLLTYKKDIESMNYFSKKSSKSRMPTFCLYLTTRLPNPDFAPEVFSKLNVINFAVKEEGLEEQLLAILVRHEMPSIENQKDNLIVDIASRIKEKQNLENLFLRLLNDTKGSLLENLEVFDTLDNSNKAETEISENLFTSQQLEREIDEAREQYRPCARRSSTLFFALNDMGSIDSMYQFSLDAYIELFVMSLDKSPTSDNIQTRITSINDYHTYSTYRYGCRGLFERHAILFSCQMCVRLLFSNNQIEPDEYNALVRGITTSDKIVVHKNIFKSWLADNLWYNLQLLVKLRRFRSLAVTFAPYAEAWRKWFEKTDSEKYPLPGGVESACGNLSRVLVLRSIRPDRVAFGILEFVEANLGSQFVNPPLPDLRAAYNDSTPYTPIMFILSSGADPSILLNQFAEEMSMSKKMFIISLGQGQSVKAEQLLNEGIVKGHWIFLANCHLSESWLSDLDQFIDNTQTNTSINKEFRLWLSSARLPTFPIATLQTAIKITTEPSRGIRTNMTRMYNSISDTKLKFAEKHSKLRRLLFPITYLHTLLLERKKFLTFGWNGDYAFNDSDHEISINVAFDLLRDNPDSTPWQALKYMIAIIMYGGHITDSWDMRLLDTYANDLFKDKLFDQVNYPTFPLSATCDAYFVPRDGSVASYISHIQKMPSVDSTEAFGQHSNANVAAQVAISNALMQNLMFLQPEGQKLKTIGDKDTKENEVFQICEEILRVLPLPVIYEEIDKTFDDNSVDPITVVFKHEIARINDLISVVHRSTEALKLAVTGFIIMSDDLEDMFQSLYDLRVPAKWKKFYVSKSAMSTWIKDLTARTAQFYEWARLHKTPSVYWLPGFAFPNGFLTALLQIAARRHLVAIDKLCWEFDFVDHSDLRAISTDTQTAVSGFHLVGASWDSHRKCLEEQFPMKLYYNMPLIMFKAIPLLKQDKLLKSAANYECPCYQISSNRERTFVVGVDMNPGKKWSTSHWVKRSVALLLIVEED
ncbi:hypothetical protein GJ496_007023 [Pomphorhynchus laevis]|nr:hypothetical protein GJ496_007023 [Pomphorhynchus laevis]